jgi:hypothetical protein
MKCILKKSLFVAGAVLSSVCATSIALSANETKTDVVVTTQTATPTEAQVNKRAKPQSISWLNEHGAITTDQVVQELGVRVTPEQRVQIEKAVQKRNRALLEANADLSASLSKTLAASDSELAKRVAEGRERRRMEIIRSRQPGRYNGIKK